VRDAGRKWGVAQQAAIDAKIKEASPGSKDWHLYPICNGGAKTGTCILLVMAIDPIPRVVSFRCHSGYAPFSPPKIYLSQLQIHSAVEANTPLPDPAGCSESDARQALGGPAVRLLGSWATGMGSMLASPWRKKERDRELQP